MKLRILLCLGLLYLLATPDQLKAQTGWRTGIVAIPAYNTFLNADDNAAFNPPTSKRELLPGMTGGLMLGYNAGAFAIRLNALYGQNGNRYSLNNITNGLEGTATCHYRGNDYPCTHLTSRLEYFKVPLLFGFETGSGALEPAKTSFSFFVGGQASFLTRANIYDNNTQFTPPTPSNETSVPDAFEQFTPIVYSGVLDFGFDFKLEEDLQLNLHVRGEYGINNVENVDASYRITEGGQTMEVPFYNPDRATTNNLSVGIMVGFTYIMRSRWN